MRLNHFFSVLGTVLLIPGIALAEDGTVSSAQIAEGLAWDQFDDPDFVPEAVTPDPAAPAAEVVADDAVIDASEVSFSASVPSGTSVRSAASIVLGPEGVDGEGRVGRLHTVARGDTLWHVSDAYLGTPWVWPSVWIENDDIENPHLIMPKDKIWITANEMRVVTDAEAETFLQNRANATAVSGDTDFGTPPLAAFDGNADDPSTLDAFPVAIPGQSPESLDSGRLVTVSRFETVGFISASDLAGASSIVDSPSERTFLSEGDKVFIGMGEGDVEIGDRFTVFQVINDVRDVETNRVLGSHVENLGWVEVQELTGDTSIGEIRQSYSEIPRGAKLVGRAPPMRKVSVRSTPDAIEGQVVFLPTWRSLVADGGYVYLNRGEFHGIEVGSHLEVIDAGAVVNERERRVDVRTPDTSVAELVVVSVEEDSSVAFVVNAKRELEIGDTIRPISAQLARN